MTDSTLRHTLDAAKAKVDANPERAAAVRESWAGSTPPAEAVPSDTVEKAVKVCPRCEGEGSYADGLDEAACSTQCTRCDGNGWIVDVAALSAAPRTAGEPVAWRWRNPGCVWYYQEAQQRIPNVEQEPLYARPTTPATLAGEELAADLHRRADACHDLNKPDRTELERARLHGKELAYRHAAHLAAALQPQGGE